MPTLRQALNIMISVALLAYIAASLFRLAVFFLTQNHLI
jgi:hypothetical protein